MFDKTKRVIIIDKIKNSNIEQAIFILKDRRDSIEEYSIIDEANGIIDSYIRSNNRTIMREVKKKRRFFGKKSASE